MMLPSNFSPFRFLFPQWKWKGEDKTAIYLTFDDGPHPEITPKVLDILSKHKVCATFFCVGINAIKYPDLIIRIKNEGHSIGNHSFNHENGWKTDESIYLDSIEKTTEVLQSKIFRPPFGKVNFKTWKVLKQKGYSLIMWSWISYDYMQKMTVEAIIKRAKKVKGGDIVVFHDNEKCKHKMVELLTAFIFIKKQEGLQFKRL